MLLFFCNKLFLAKCRCQFSRYLSSYMLLDLRIIIVHQIASHGRISSSRDIGDIYTRFGICLLAVGSILEGVSKL